MNVGMGKESADKEAMSPGFIRDKARAATEALAGKLSKGELAKRLERANRAVFETAGPISSKREALQEGIAAGAKHASGMPTLLEVIRPTLNQSDVNKFFDKIAADRGLQAACVANAVSMEPAIRILAETPTISNEKRASALLQRIKPMSRSSARRRRATPSRPRNTASGCRRFAR